MMKDRVSLVLALIGTAVLIWLGIVLGLDSANRPTADQRYGCTAAQQAPNGECK